MTTSLTTANEPSAPSFAALHLSEPVLRALEEIGYSEPTPVQSATYPVAIAGRDLIVQARTGTGKTAAFGIPLVDKLVSSERHVQALVLAPTRELAVQSQREIARIGQHKGLQTVAIYGGAPMGRQIDELQSGAQIVSGTPGRVLDHLRRGTLEPSRLRVLVLDEMDEMLSMGFAKELNAILELLPPRGKRQTMCFSATVDGEVRRHAERHMHEPDIISLSSDAVAAEQITHQVFMVTGRDRIGDLVRVLEVDDPESALIFCNMRSETERVATALLQAGFNADWLNGDLPQKDRERIMASTREGKLRYLVATDVAARGIDISHLTHVINYTFPESAAVYVHRTGRTGRAGRTGTAISLVGPEELGRLYYLRLEYKISPVERSLPTSGERKTRAELDRVEMLASAFVHPPSATDLAVARRLLTHADAERILGGLLHTFFGTRDEVDEEAAAARRTRTRPVEPEPEPIAAANGRDGSRGGRERPGRDRERPVRARPREAQAPDADAARERGPREDRGPRDDLPRDDRPRDDRPRDDRGPRDDRPRDDRGPRDDRPRDDRGPRDDRPRDDRGPRDDRPRDDRGPRATPREDRGPRDERTAPREDRGPSRGDRGSSHERERTREAAPILAGPAADSIESASLTRDTRRETSPREPATEPRPRSRARHTGQDGQAGQSGPTDADTDSDAAADSDEHLASGGPDARLSGLLYLNLGRRDGVRVGDLARLLRESCELSRAEIGRIRVRDRYTLVDVPEERLDVIIATLGTQTLNDRALAPERAKTTKA
jgi:ATP-dependent RNA helicase DeaD